MKNRYLLWFANEHVDFRVPEMNALISLFKINMNASYVKECENPFWMVELSSESEARLLASRAIGLRSVLKLWAHGTSLAGLHNSLKGYPTALIKPYISAEKSFRVDVTTFNKTISMKEKVERIEMFDYLPAAGSVNLKNPDHVVHFIEDYGPDPNNVPESAHHYYFGLWLCDGQRSRIHQLSLKTRKFIGNTSMDTQLSLVMANMARVKPGDFVFDPFVGSGSLLVAAASFGAVVVGSDIDYLMLHGRTRPTRKQDRLKPRDRESILANMKQYGLTSQYIDVVVADSSLPLWRDTLQFDAIITDPPYGVREATERIGSRKKYDVSAEHAATHIPCKVDYTLSDIFSDLLQLAARRLVVYGRLVTWMPIRNGEEPELPSHPALTLKACSVQPLSAHTARRLITWEKSSDQPDATASIPELFPNDYRHQYFHRDETRKQRRERIRLQVKLRTRSSESPDGIS